MTQAQRKALDRLIVIGIENLNVINRVGHHPHVVTGVHTMTLHRLRDAGFIACDMIYIGGKTSPDLRILKTE